MIQAASDSGNAGALVFFLFDLLYLNGEAISDAPLRERKERLRDLLSNAAAPLQYSDHQIGRGSEFYAKACELSLEGIISKRADAPYSPGDRGLWVKVRYTLEPGKFYGHKQLTITSREASTLELIEIESIPCSNAISPCRSAGATTGLARPTKTRSIPRSC